MKEHKLRKTLFQLFTLGILMFVTYYLIMRDQEFEDVWQVITSTNKLCLIAGMALMALFVFCGGFACKVLMEGMHHNLTIGQCFKYSLVDFYFSSITPSNTGGQPMELIYMKHDGYPVVDSSVVLLAVTVLGRVALLTVSAVMFAISLPFVASRAVAVLPFAILGFVANLILISFLLIVLFSKKLTQVIVNFTVKILGKLHLIKDQEETKREVAKKLSHYHECSTFFFEHKKLVLKAFGVLMIQRLSLLSVTYMTYIALGLNEYTYFEITAIQCLLNLCTDLMPLPGAVGITETVFLMLFAPIFTEAKVTTAVLLSRGISFYLVLIVSALFIFGYRLYSIVKGNKMGKNVTFEDADDEQLEDEL